MLPLIEPLAVLLSLTGAYLVASPLSHRRQIAFILWMLANTLWVVSGINTRSPYIVLLFGVYFIFAARGYLSIGKGEKVAV